MRLRAVNELKMGVTNVTRKDLIAIFQELEQRRTDLESRNDPVYHSVEIERIEDLQRKILREVQDTLS